MSNGNETGRAVAVTGYAVEWARHQWPGARVTPVEWVADVADPYPSRAAVAGPRELVAEVIRHALGSGVYVDRVDVDGSSHYAPADDTAGYVRGIARPGVADELAVPWVLEVEHADGRRTVLDQLTRDAAQTFGARYALAADVLEVTMTAGELERCAGCAAGVHPLATFPGGVCVSCWSRTDAGRQMPTSGELVAMWGGR